MNKSTITKEVTINDTTKLVFMESGRVIIDQKSAILSGSECVILDEEAINKINVALLNRKLEEAYGKN